MKIQLIEPPTDESYGGKTIDEFMSAPIGLEILAKRIGHTAEVQIIDGSRISLATVLDEVKADWVGVRGMYSTQRNTLAILGKAKTLGAKTVAGGPNINHIAERILRNRSFVDYAVVGDGEEALPLLISGTEPAEIPNLAHRVNDGVILNVRRNATLDTIFDLKEINPQQYSPKTPFPLSSIRGCQKSEKFGRCVFCSMNHRLVVMNPEQVWQQIALLYERYSFDYFFETGDSFLVGNFPRQLLQSRPDKLAHVKFRIYAAPEDITAETSNLLKALNVSFVFLGLESANNDILARIGKQYQIKDVGTAIKLLSERGIHIQIPFMYGLPGESLSTLKETYSFAENVAKTNPNLSFLVSYAVPLIGSRMFQQCTLHPKIREEYPGDLHHDDVINYRALQELFVEYLTYTRPEMIREYIDKTSKLVHTWGRLGVNE